MTTLKENILAKFPSLPVVQAPSIYDLQHLPAKEVSDLESEWVNHIATLADHFGAKDYVGVKALKSQW